MTHAMSPTCGGRIARARTDGLPQLFDDHRVIELIVKSAPYGREVRAMLSSQPKLASQCHHPYADVSDEGDDAKG